MRKNKYILLAAALTAGVMMTACTPKAETGKEETTVESTVAETIVEESTESATGEILQDETLEKVHDAVKKAYGDNYIPNMPYDTTALTEVFGLDPELYDAVIAEGPMISVNVETFIGVKAKEGKSKEVAEALEEYRRKQLEEAVQYPMNMVKLEAASVVTKGDYVFFVMLGSADEAEEVKGEKEALESAKKNNQIAIDVIDEIITQ